MFTLPFVAILGMIYYCGTEFHDVAKWIYYGVYLGLVGILAWGGSPTFRGYSQMDSWLVRYIETERSKERSSCSAANELATRARTRAGGGRPAIHRIRDVVRHRLSSARGVVDQ